MTRGNAQPPGMGIAAQMGLWLDCPTIGTSTSCLYNRPQEVRPHPGD
ncbi:MULTISPECIES: endonuclease V [Caldilinea]